MARTPPSFPRKPGACPWAEPGAALRVQTRGGLTREGNPVAPATTSDTISTTVGVRESVFVDPGVSDIETILGDLRCECSSFQ